jgi:hypothetical protein
MASLLLIGTLVGSSIAQTRDPRLADLTEPGSVIIFPKFIRGALTVDGVPAQPRTEISIGVVCPPGFFCAEGTKVKIKFHWVCGTDENPLNSFVCNENDFEAIFTVNGKIIFNTEGTTAPGNFISPAPPCNRGYLIGWVIDTLDRPIKFDGLTGTAVLRESPTAVTAYKGITIQAHPALALNALITLATEGTGPAQTRGLPFTGAPGQYQAITGVLMGDIEYDKVTAPSHTTVLTLLTLDTRSNRPNFPTFVDFDIWNAIEQPFSFSTNFVCWQEIGLLALAPNALSGFIGSRKGVFRTGPAEKFAIGGVADTAGAVTLLGLLEVLEGPTAASPPCAAGTGPDAGNVLPCVPIPYTTGNERHVIYEAYNDSLAIPTTFWSRAIPVSP